jgi:hypothetical protein
MNISPAEQIPEAGSRLTCISATPLGPERQSDMPPSAIFEFAALIGNPPPRGLRSIILVRWF